MVKCVLCGKVEVRGAINQVFHRFPANSEKRSIWLSVINITSVAKTAKICSDHFDPEDYITRQNGQKVLKMDATPKLIGQYFSSAQSSESESSEACNEILYGEQTESLTSSEGSEDSPQKRPIPPSDTEPSTSLGTVRIDEEQQFSETFDLKEIGVAPLYHRYQIPSEDPEDEPGPSSRFRDDDPLANMKVEPEEVKLDPAYVKSEPTEEESSESALQFPDKILMGWYDDDVDTFFKKVADTVKQLPDYLATEARQRIFEMLRELQERAVKKENVL